jgi:hypothetical protein
MSSALEAFRAQKEAVDQVHARLTEVAALVRGLQAQVDAIAQDQALRMFLRDEQTLLERAERTVQEVRAFRELEMRRFWPAMWRRWVVAVAFALASAVAFGSGYVLASRPYYFEHASLRARVELVDSVAQRVIRMTTLERRQFDDLMKLKPAAR